MSKKEEKRIWKKVKELRKKGLLPLPSADDIKNEPTALANSQYRLQNKDEYYESLVEKSEQLKCQCKKAKFTRTVDADFNPLCGRCGKAL